MNAKTLLACATLVVMATVCSHGQKYPFQNTTLSWEVRVADVVGRLTLEEIQEQMGRGGTGDIGGPAPAIPRLGIGPFSWPTECLRGDAGAGNATAFPQALGLAAAFSPDLIFRVAQATGVEVRSKHNDYQRHGEFSTHTGINCFSPVVNIMRDPRWGRNQETYGEDPFLSGVYAKNFVQGLQGNHPRYVRASAGCKHFDVHGGPEDIPSSRFKFDAKVTERDWRTTFLPAFRSCAEAGVYGYMCSFNKINGIPSCANKELLTNIARGEWGFKGFVISDQGAVELVMDGHHYYNNSVDTVAGCVNAGLNLELSSNLQKPVYFYMLDAIKQGKLTEATVRNGVAPLFYTRMRLGEFDPPEMNPYTTLSIENVESPEHKALAVEAAMKSFVLLKNDGQVLPLKSSTYSSIAIVGPMADNPSQLFGDYAADPPPEDVTTPLQGLTSIADSVNFVSGCNDTNCQAYNAEDVIRTVSGKNDIVFIITGTGPAVEMEGHDRPDMELPGQQRNMLLDVINHTPVNIPIVLLLFNAGPVNISFADQDPRVSAILECFFPAQATGEALRHVLLNDVKGAVPAGRLPFTWPLLATDVPPMTDYSMKGRTYRYSHALPRYPFGYGLSYTTFEYVGDTHTAYVKAGEPLKGTFWIQNKGKYVADEVTQIYITWRDLSLPVPKVQLAWFNRYTVPHGQMGLSINYTIDARSMAVWMDDGWHVKPGMMGLYIGGEQPFQRRRAENTFIEDEFEITGSAYLGKY